MKKVIANTDLKISIQLWFFYKSFASHWLEIPLFIKLLKSFELISWIPVIRETDLKSAVISFGEDMGLGKR